MYLSVILQLRTITIWERQVRPAKSKRTQIPGMREHYKSTKKRIHTSFMENASATTPDPMTLFVMFTMDPPTVALASDSCLLLSGMKSSSISSLPSGVPTCISTFHVQQSACYVSGDTGGSGFRTNRDKKKLDCQQTNPFFRNIFTRNDHFFIMSWRI